MNLSDRIHQFYREVFDGSNAQAAENYLAPEYVQHNPGVPTTRAGFISQFDAAFKSGKKFRLKILKIVEGEGYAMVLLGHIKPDGSVNPNGDLVDLYKVDGEGRLCEHWDIFSRRETNG